MSQDDRGAAARRQRDSRSRSGSRRDGRTSRPPRGGPDRGSTVPPNAPDDLAPDDSATDRFATDDPTLDMATADGAAADGVEPDGTVTASAARPVGRPLVGGAPAARTTAAGGSTLVAGRIPDVDRTEISRAAVEGALRGALTMVAGYATTVAVGLVLWAIDPGTDVGAEPAVRSATAAYVLGHFGHVGIAGSALTLPPLLLALVFGLVLALGPGRGRTAGSSAAAEAASIGAGSVVYAALVVAAAVTLAPPGVAVLGAAVGAFLLALAALTIGMLRRRGALHALALVRLPRWSTAGAVAGGAALLTVVAGAGVVFAVALGRQFGRATDLASTLSNGAGDAIGLAVAGLGYLPNAVVATVGYVTGAGYQVGPGRYSPFGSVPADLPPFPLLAAVPATNGVSVLGLLSLAVPIAAGLVAALAVLRRVAGRRERWAAVATAAVVGGVLAGVLVQAASGGVDGGPWPRIGAIGWQVGPLLAAWIAVVAGAWVAAAARGAAPAAGAPAVLFGAAVPDDDRLQDDLTEHDGAHDPDDAGAASRADSEADDDRDDGSDPDLTDGSETQDDRDLDSEPDSSSDEDPRVGPDLDTGPDRPLDDPDLDADSDSDSDGPVDAPVESAPDDPPAEPDHPGTADPGPHPDR